MDKIIIAGLTICSVGVVILTYIQQSRQHSEALKSKEEQLNQKDEIIKEFKNLITGGDSFLYLHPSKVLGTNEVLFVIDFKGKYPIYDATILIEEFDLINMGNNHYQYQRTSDRTITLGTVNPLQKNLLFKTEIPQGHNEQFGKRYFFKITSRNGLTEEDVYLRKEGLHFTHAFKVVFFEPDYSGQFGNIGIGKILRKIRHIDPGFPVHQLEHIEGDSGWKPSYEAQTGIGIN